MTFINLISDTIKRGEPVVLVIDTYTMLMKALLFSLDKIL